jgi:hypothetical protein
MREAEIFVASPVWSDDRGLINSYGISQVDRAEIKSFIDDSSPCQPTPKIRTKADLRSAKGFGKRSE